jgi:hypothetical protein
MPLCTGRLHLHAASALPLQMANPAPSPYRPGVQIPTKDGGTEYLVQPGERLQFELTLVQVAVPNI